MSTILEKKEQLELQFLIRRYLVQFRYGCQNPGCTTKLCYSFRKKISPESRRPSLLKARMMAYAIVDSDIPYSKLCPYPPYILPQDMDAQLPTVSSFLSPSQAETEYVIYWDSTQHGGTDFTETLNVNHDSKIECLLAGAEEALDDYISPKVLKSNEVSASEDFKVVEPFISTRFGLSEDIKDRNSIGQHIFSSANYTRFETECLIDDFQTLQNVLGTNDTCIVTQKTTERINSPISWLRKFSGGLSSDNLYIARSLGQPIPNRSEAFLDISVINNSGNMENYQPKRSFFIYNLPSEIKETETTEIVTFGAILHLKNSIRDHMDPFQPWQRSWAQQHPEIRKKVSQSLDCYLGTVERLVSVLKMSKKLNFFDSHPFDAFNWKSTQPYLLFNTLSRSLDELITPPEVVDSSIPHRVSDNHAQIVIALSITALISFTHIKMEAPDSHVDRFWNLIHLLVSERKIFLHPIQCEDPEATEIIQNYQERIYEVMDSFSDDRAVAFALKIIKTIAVRQAFAELQNSKTPNQPAYHSFHGNLLMRLYSIFRTPGSSIPPIHGSHILGAWIKNIVLRFWDGKPVLNRWDAGGAALEFLNSLKREWGERSSSRFFDWLEKGISTEDIVSFRTYEDNPNTLHLMSLCNLFSSETSIMHFRTLNYAELFSSYQIASFLTIFPQKILKDSDTRLLDIARSRLSVAQSPLLYLKVRRDYLLKDAMDQLWKREPRELKRALKVDIDGESGVDQGGVSQEFFQLVFAQIFDPNSGLFSIDEDSGMAWFRSKSIEKVSTFELVGILMGIGVHNGIILPVSFPKIFYKRLLGEEIGGLESIRDGWPTLYRSLRAIWTFDESPEGEAFEDIFGLETVLSHSNNGVYEEIDYVHGGERYSSADSKADVITIEDFRPEPVSMENKIKYINKLLQWILDISIRREFEAFRKGFFAVIDRSTMSVVYPHILKKIVEGHENFDVSILEEKAQYSSENFGSDNEVVIWFWDVLKSYPLDLRKAFLKFTFGTDRIAAQSLQYVTFIIEPYFSGEYPQAEGGQEALPTVSSCFGILRLPEYQSKEVLKRKLTMALENCEGFGIA